MKSCIMKSDIILCWHCFIIHSLTYVAH